MIHGEPDRPSVERLVSEAAVALHAAGQFVTTFRDCTVPLLDERRFIHVRSDSDRILTCFLEYHSTHVVVHDLIHEGDGPDLAAACECLPETQAPGRIRLGDSKVGGL